MDLMQMLGFKKDLIALIIDEAIAYIERGEIDCAIEVLETKALRREPNHPRVLLHLGVCHMLKGDYDVAEGILLPLSQRKPMDSESAAAQIALEKVRKDRAAGENAE